MQNPSEAEETAREKALKKLSECKKGRDIEAAHVEADEVLCELLTELGYEDVVFAWNRVEKWYS